MYTLLISRIFQITVPIFQASMAQSSWNKSKYIYTLQKADEEHLRIRITWSKQFTSQRYMTLPSENKTLDLVFASVRPNPSKSVLF